MPPPVLSRISKFLGISSLNATGRDAYLIISLRSLRMFSAGIPSLILALFFSSLGFPDSRIGAFMTLTLVGDVLLSLILTLVADALGRRRVLFIGSAMMALSGTAFALSENFWVLLIAAVCGVISVTGADTGPFRAIEESVLSGLTDENTRSDVLSWYVTFTTLAGAVGTEVAGRVVTFVESLEKSGETKAFHVLFWGYALFGVVACILCCGLSRRCEVAGERGKAGKTFQGKKYVGVREGGIDGEEEEVLLEEIPHATTGDANVPASVRQEEGRDIREKESNPKKKSYFSQISKPTRSIMFKLWALLGIDSLADGMTPFSLLNYYLDQKFHLSKATLGDITSAAQFLCAVSAIFAGPMAKHFGLINTMVFTHLPSSIASAFIALPGSVGWTVALILFKAALNSMDQAPRTAFIAAVVKPEERTGVMGITAMVRTGAMSAGPAITGLLAGGDAFWVAFVATGICRIIYDVGLWVLFINVKVDGNREEEDDVDSVDDDAWNGLLSDTDSEILSGTDDAGTARGSKDSTLKSV